MTNSESSRFAVCLAFVLQAEGGFVDNPADPGGATMHGVTQAVYDAYRAKLGLDPRSVALIADSEVSDIYQSEYWTPICGDQLPVGVDLCVFDFGVNSGVGHSAKYLQEAVGVTADGAIGPQTIAAVQAAAPVTLANQLLDMRAAFYQQVVTENPSEAEFLSGWMNRVAALRALIQ